MPSPSILRVFCIAALAAVAACESGTEPGSSAGEISGMWAGEAWEGDAWASIQNDSLYLSGSSPAGARTGETVTVAVGGFRGPGAYSVGPDAGQVRYIVGGDGIWASYSTAQASSGMLVVTSVDGARIAGYVDFVADAQRGHEPAGPRARFDGEFRVRVQLPHTR